MPGSFLLRHGAFNHVKAKPRLLVRWRHVFLCRLECVHDCFCDGLNGLLGRVHHGEVQKIGRQLAQPIRLLFRNDGHNRLAQGMRRARFEKGVIRPPCPRFRND